jgi:hypothetical protein
MTTRWLRASLRHLAVAFIQIFSATCVLFASESSTFALKGVTVMANACTKTSGSIAYEGLDEHAVVPTSSGTQLLCPIRPEVFTYTKIRAVLYDSAPAGTDITFSLYKKGVISGSSTVMCTWAPSTSMASWQTLNSGATCSSASLDTEANSYWIVVSFASSTNVQKLNTLGLSE